LDDVEPVDEGSATACTELATETCVTPGNPLIGACRAGSRTCSGGVWGPCSDVKPAETDGCNGIDDNCNGIVDEDCPESCVVVCNNCGADGAASDTYSTIEEAIAAAGQADGGIRTRICVAGGTSCDDQATYSMSGALTMSDGLVVQGNYAVTADGPKYCKSTNSPNTTIAFTGQDQGVVFDQSIATRSELSGFVIHRASDASIGSAASGIAGVLVSGAKNVSLSRIFMTDRPTGTITYGVKITAGGQATIVGSAIASGEGRTAYGVYVSGGSVELRNNCDRFSGGNCATTCDGAGLLGIFGRATDSLVAGETSAVYVGNGGGSNSNIVANTLCGGYSSLGDGTRVAALRCDGSGCASIAGNTISGGNDQESIGIAIAGASPLVESNRIEGGCGTRATTGLFFDGASGIVRNNRIYGGRVAVGLCVGGAIGTGPATQKLLYGMHLRSTAGAPSNPAVHSNDIEPLGPSADSALACQSAGVLVERPSSSGSSGGGTLRNNVISAGTCAQRFAIRQTGDGGLTAIENNNLYGPSAPAAGAAVLYRQGNTSITSIDGLDSIPGTKGNVSADPGYASYPSDLHLTVDSSACIDTGTAVDAPETDADGALRPQGAGYDIGAYELAR
jgi:hypothetical protein